MSVKLKAVRQLECTTICEIEGCYSTGMCHFEIEDSQSVKLKAVHQLECTTLKLKVLKVGL